MANMDVRRAGRAARAGPGSTRSRRAGARPRVALAAICVVGILSVACSPAPREVRITLLGTTDVHGHLLPYDYATGDTADHSLAQLATLVDSVREADSHVLLFDSGDLLQGTPLDEYEAEVGGDSVHPVIATMNAMRYTASAVGNHEYNYGIPFLDSALADARFPFLAANILRASTDSPVYRPYVVREVAGVRVAVLGFTTPGVAIWDRKHVEGRQAFEGIVEAARTWVPRVRRREHPDLVVALVHSGLGPGSSYDTATGVPPENAAAALAGQVDGIDVIFAGHSHVRLTGRRIGGTLVVQAGHFADVLAAVHATLGRSGGAWTLDTLTSELLPARGEPSDSAIARRLRPVQDRVVAWLEQPIGTTPDRWSAARGRIEDSPTGDLVTTVERRVSGADLASTAIFDPEASFGPGPISRRDILALYIYPNTLAAVRISGAQLRAYLERSARYYRGWPSDTLVDPSVPGFNYDVVSGVDYALDLTRPPGRRVVGLTYRGRPVAAADSFTLALNNYRETGGGGFSMVAGAPVVYSGQEAISQLIIDYIRSRGTLRTEDVFDPNWRLLPPAAVRALAGSPATARRH